MFVQLLPRSCGLSSLCKKSNIALRLFNLHTANSNVTTIKLVKTLWLLNLVNTSDIQRHWWFRSPQFVLYGNFVFPVVFGSHSQYKQGADSTYICDVVVGVCVEADIVPVPRNTWSWITLNGTAHVAFITLWGCTPLQGNNKWGRRIEDPVFYLWPVYLELFWNKELQKVIIF